MPVGHNIINKIPVKTWLVSILISLAFLGLLFLLSDLQQVKGYFHEINASLFLLAFLFFFIEGVFTSLRIYIFTPGAQKISDCYIVNAWFVFLLIILPARLGEISIIYLYKKYLNQAAGPALMNVLLQRVLDMLVLVTIFLLAAICINTLSFDMSVYLLAIIALAILVSSLFYLYELLTFLAITLIRYNSSRNYRLIGKIIKAVLQARMWYRHHISKRRFIASILMTIGKWFSNLVMIVLVFQAFGLEASFFKEIFLASSFNFLSIIPLQAIGGIGVGETALTGLFLAFGYDIDYSIGISIFTRFSMIVFSLAYFSLVLLVINKILIERYK